MRRAKTSCTRAAAALARGALCALFTLAAFPVDAADAPAGRRKAGTCVACHGENGISVQPNAPNLAGQPAVYVADQLRQFRSGKRPSEVMAVIAKPLSDQDIDDLAAWYESIRVQATPPP
jgi:cytochrome c553